MRTIGAAFEKLMAPVPFTGLVELAVVGRVVQCEGLAAGDIRRGVALVVVINQRSGADVESAETGKILVVQDLGGAKFQVTGVVSGYRSN